MKFRSFVFSAVVLAALAACSSGSSSVPGPGGGISTTNSESILIPATAGSVVTAPAAAGVTPSLAIPAISAPFNATVVTSSTVPSGITALAHGGPVVQSLRRTESLPADITTLLYVSMVPQTTVTVQSAATATFQFIAAANYFNSAINYYLALYDGTAWHTEYVTTPGTLSASGTLTFSVPITTAFSINAGTTYAYALYDLQGAATPTPGSGAGVSASSSPTPAASPTAGSTPNTGATSGISSSPTPAASAAPFGSLQANQVLNAITLNDGTKINLTLGAQIGANLTYDSYASLSAINAAQVGDTTAGTPNTACPTTAAATFQGGVIVTGPASSATGLPTIAYTLLPGSTSVGNTYTVIQCGVTSPGQTLYALAQQSVGTGSSYSGVITQSALVTGFTNASATTYTLGIYTNLPTSSSL